MLNTQFQPWPKYSSEEIRAVELVLQSNKVNYWTGNECRSFENEFATWTGVDYAIAVSNGTLALELALRGLGIGSGDDVVTTPRTFVATASSIVSVGANPVFADVDINSQNITAESIEAVITKNTKAIIVVHLGGMPADLDPIMELANKHNLLVIEDCAQAHGAKYKGKSVGSIGHVGAWSFCQDKIMTTGGEGGMVTTNLKAVWSKMWSYKDHGKSWDAVYNKNHPLGFRWLHESFGSNWRMTEMQAAIGRIQLRKMDEWTEARHSNSSLILDECEKHEVFRVPSMNRSLFSKLEDNSYKCVHAYYKLYVFIEPNKLSDSWDRDRFISEINSRGVPCYSGSCSEIYLEKAFESIFKNPPKRLPCAKLLGETSLMFLVHPTLDEREITKTCQVIGEVASLALKIS